MPHCNYLVEERTPEQKRQIAERVTNVLIEDGKAKRENIHVSFPRSSIDELRPKPAAGSGPETHAVSKLWTRKINAAAPRRTEGNPL